MNVNEIEQPPPVTAGGAAERVGGVAPVSFGERLTRLVGERGSQLVLGLDPDPMRLWPRAIELAGGPGHPPAPAAQRAALAVAIHCTLAIEAAGEHCVAIKPQLACFERLGAPGLSALAEVVERAHEHGLLVIADGKRGDVAVTASAYAQAFFGETPTPYGTVRGIGVDALTVNPLLGTDSVVPLLRSARERGAGLFLLVRTSNPDASEIQELAVTGGGTVSGRLARLVAELGESSAAGPVADGPVGDVGAVVGATAPDRLEALRAQMPRAPFLLPGVGMQGGRVEDLAAAFSPGPAGGLVSASRGIVNAYLQVGGDPATAARQEAARLRDVAWNLAA